MQDAPYVRKWNFNICWKRFHTAEDETNLDTYNVDGEYHARQKVPSFDLFNRHYVDTDAYNCKFHTISTFLHGLCRNCSQGIQFMLALLRGSTKVSHCSLLCYIQDIGLDPGPKYFSKVKFIANVYNIGLTFIFHITST